MLGRPEVAIIGGGPAGLMAAEVLSGHDLSVTVYEAMPSLGRKFLMAGKSGLNISKIEPLDAFAARYLQSDPRLRAALDAFGPKDVVTWMAGLGVEVHQGSSGRLFPKEMKASPLLRAWIKRLSEAGVQFHLKTRWTGCDSDGALLFRTPDGVQRVATDAVILAMGGGSWRRLGSDGQWTDILSKRGVQIEPFKPSNGGFLVDWSDVMKERFAGTPVKATELVAPGGAASRGEWVVTARGIEGGGVYEISQDLRDALIAGGDAVLTINLIPGRSKASVAERLSRPQGKQSLSNHWRKAVGLTGVKAALLREFAPKSDWGDPNVLASLIKALPLPLKAAAPIDEAISTAGGVPWAELDDHLMLKKLPGVYCAGEMIAWDAPTGGYLLTACMALGRAAGRRALVSLNGTAPTA
ncbi:MAG: TIGR03862 family flavoprotein [Pseudomonadota bacterium]